MDELLFASVDLKGRVGVNDRNALILLVTFVQSSA